MNPHAKGCPAPAETCVCGVSVETILRARIRELEVVRKPTVRMRRKRPCEDFWKVPVEIVVDGEVRAMVWWVNGKPYLKWETCG